MKTKIEEIITKDTILFFDMDGTLIETNMANFLSYKKAIQSVTKNKVDFTYNKKQRFNRTLLKVTIPNLTEREYERIIQEKERFYKDFLSETKLNEEVAAFLFNYSKTNITVLVTNCRENRVTETLRYYGLTDKFSQVFCRQLSDTTTRINKYSNAIAKLAILPQSVVVFENEKMEIDDAIKAGIPYHNIVDFLKL